MWWTVSWGGQQLYYCVEEDSCTFVFRRTAAVLLCLAGQQLYYYVEEDSSCTIVLRRTAVLLCRGGQLYYCVRRTSVLLR